MEQDRGVPFQPRLGRRLFIGPTTSIPSSMKAKDDASFCSETIYRKVRLSKSSLRFSIAFSERSTCFVYMMFRNTTEAPAAPTLRLPRGSIAPGMMRGLCLSYVLKLTYKWNGNVVLVRQGTGGFVHARPGSKQHYGSGSMNKSPRCLSPRF